MDIAQREETADGPRTKKMHKKGNCKLKSQLANTTHTLECLRIKQD